MMPSAAFQRVPSYNPWYSKIDTQNDEEDEDDGRETPRARFQISCAVVLFFWGILAVGAVGSGVWMSQNVADSDPSGDFSPIDGLDKPMLCVYPISGQYGIQPRVLYYVSLGVGSMYGKHEWLTIGALGSAFTYAGATAIHAFVLIATASGDAVFDFDNVACACILIPAMAAAVFLCSFNPRLWAHRAFPIVIMWIVLISISAVAATVGSNLHRPHEAPCLSENGSILLQPDQYNATIYNCTYSCFASSSSHLREVDEVRAFDDSYYLVRGWVLAGAFALSWGAAVVFSGLYLLAAITFRGCGIFYSRKIPWLTVMGATAYIFCIACLEMGIIGQIMKLFPGSELPAGEAPFAVGQWSTIVVAALVLLAAVVDWWTRGTDEDEEASPKTFPVPQPAQRVETRLDVSGRPDEIQLTPLGLPIISRLSTPGRLMTTPVAGLSSSDTAHRVRDTNLLALSHTETRSLV